jgi:hypothetical protein
MEVREEWRRFSCMNTVYLITINNPRIIVRILRNHETRI